MSITLKKKYIYIKIKNRKKNTTKKISKKTTHQKISKDQKFSKFKENPKKS